MAIGKGFNFRGTSGFVTDATDETYVIGDIYPVTRNGLTFGWLTAGVNALDRDATVERRLAGINYILNGGSQLSFQVDLPAAGAYTIRLALGDTGGTQGYQYLQVKDDTTVKFTIDDTNGTAQDNYNDATGVDLSEVAWPASNAARVETFSSLKLIVVIGSPTAQSGSSTLAHLFVASAASGNRVLTNNLRPSIFTPGLPR